MSGDTTYAPEETVHGPAFVYPFIDDFESYVLDLGTNVLLAEPQRSFLLAAIEPLAEIEASFAGVIAMRDIDAATGDILTKLAAAEGEGRSGMGDDELRRIVKGRRRANVAHGKPEGIYATWIALAGTDRVLVRRWPSDNTVNPCVLLEAVVSVAPSMFFQIAARAILLDSVVAEPFDIIASMMLDGDIDDGDTLPLWGDDLWTFQIV